MSAQQSYFVETWGCQMNELDSRYLEGILQARGLRPAADAGAAEVVLLNTCAVREKAVHKVASRLGELERLRRATGGPEVVGLCGCVAEQDGARLLARSRVLSFVLGPGRIGQLGAALDAAAAGERVTELGFTGGRDWDSAAIARGGRARQLVTVVHGCNQHCTFCVVPYTRGHEESRILVDIVNEINNLQRFEAREITLLRQSVNGEVKLVDDALARHRYAETLASQFVHQGERTLTCRDRLDEVLLHPVWGYVLLLVILLSFFEVVYGIGRLIEPPLLTIFEKLTVTAVTPLGVGSFWGVVVNGVLQGITAGVAIVLPYLLPFRLGLGLLEDIGYLPRLAFLMDALMHRIGLHGKAIVPFILGYGCNVPAVMSTRTLEEPRDRFMAAALATLVPCAARLAVVFGLVAFYLGPLSALLLYVFNWVSLTRTSPRSIRPSSTPTATATPGTVRTRI